MNVDKEKYTQSQRNERPNTKNGFFFPSPS